MDIDVIAGLEQYGGSGAGLVFMVSYLCSSASGTAAATNTAANGQQYPVKQPPPQYQYPAKQPAPASP